MFGILRSGMVCVPVLPEHPDNRIADIAALASANLAVAQADSLVRAERIMPGKALPALGHNPAPTPTHSPVVTDTAYVLFTSGSTGSPKSVAVAHRSVVNLLQALDERIYGGGEEPLRVSLNAPLAFDACMKQIFQLTCGRTLVAIPQPVRRDPDALIEFVHLQRLDVFDTTPTILNAMIERGFGASPDKLPGRILIGGEAMSQSLWDTVARWSGCAVWNVYGPTEATVNTLVAPVVQTPYPTLGSPLTNVCVAVVDSDGYEVPIGARGELLISGAGVAQGYVGASTAEQAKFATSASGAETYWSGDVVRRLADGTFAYIGRNDDQVKVAGQRLELEEIRHRLETHPTVRSAAVVLDDREANSPRIIAAVTSTISAPEVRDDGMLRVALPNGLRIASTNANETQYQYKEIFEDKIYTDPGLPYPPDAVVFDVGANIGMFTIFVARYAPRARIFSFEPLAPIRKRLTCNVASYAPNATIVPCALANAPGETEFTYYPGYSMMSGRAQDADVGAERTVIETFLSNASRKGDKNAAVLHDNLDDLLHGRFDPETHRCTVRRLSDVIDELGVERVDLLKVDVQRAELDVLSGIEPRHFTIIRSIALEIHDDPGGKTAGRVRVISDLLMQAGFEVRVTQDELLRGTDRWNCVAVRRTGFAPILDPVDFSKPLLEPVPADPAMLRNFLAVELPQYMLPDRIAVLDVLPMTAQGKLDRQELLKRIDTSEASQPRPTTYLTPTDTTKKAPEPARDCLPIAEQRRILLEIWRGTLRKPELGKTDDFFQNGGDSIRAIMMQSQARKAGIAINLSALNTAPTIDGLLPEVEVAPSPAPAGNDSGAARQVMLDLWRKVLRCPNFAESEDFYTKGGDSIRAIMLQSQARKAGYPFALKILNENPVFADFYVAAFGGAGACPIGRVPAGEIEAAVIDQLRAVFRQPEIVAGTWKAARAHADGITEADARSALQQLDPMWDELFPAEQARIVALLVARVDIGADGLNVRLRIDGLGDLARELLAGGLESAA